MVVITRSPAALPSSTARDPSGRKFDSDRLTRRATKRGGVESHAPALGQTFHGVEAHRSGRSAGS